MCAPGSCVYEGGMGNATDTDTIVLHLPYLAVVPVGHRVELRYYDQKKQGLLSTRQVSHDDPIVVDLDTGIEYGPDWLYDDRETYHREIEPYPAEPGPGFTLRRTIPGRVIRSRVITEIYPSAIFDNRLVTTLEIDRG